MDYTGYQLENAYRKISERHNQSEKDALVAELKKSYQHQPISACRNFIGQTLIKLGQRLVPTATA